MNVSNKVQWVYSSKNNHELSDRYNQWAKDYERDLNETFGRLNREPIVDLTIKYVPRNAQILDVGAGTGVVGQWLQQEGFHNLVGIDMSEGMLTGASQFCKNTKIMIS
ncbi:MULTISPECIES: class I SAM-dependent methyltransferase [unclassified Moorena]|uniref:methyltransferase domain-containing protein n=1 Tax=unclassified Moorena TaxID=2683338 RepID=UPI0013FF7F25|nr:MULTISPECIES: class I SAM-dependent methyltransferase [unclassified Moorena]NEO17737.1 methyltransferase domain-containing protein [Moorena sp. SIO3E8]NEQ04286.1 methyltransferase domain-containing protein [Moorena sp. SIO3F7]